MTPATPVAGGGLVNALDLMDSSLDADQSRGTFVIHNQTLKSINMAVVSKRHFQEYTTHLLRKAILREMALRCKRDPDEPYTARPDYKDFNPDVDLDATLSIRDGLCRGGASASQSGYTNMGTPPLNLPTTRTLHSRLRTKWKPF